MRAKECDTDLVSSFAVLHILYGQVLALAAWLKGWPALRLCAVKTWSTFSENHNKNTKYRPDGPGPYTRPHSNFHASKKELDASIYLVFGT